MSDSSSGFTEGWWWIVAVFSGPNNMRCSFSEREAEDTEGARTNVLRVVWNVESGP